MSRLTRARLLTLFAALVVGAGALTYLSSPSRADTTDAAAPMNAWDVVATADRAAGEPAALAGNEVKGAQVAAGTADDCIVLGPDLQNCTAQSTRRAADDAGTIPLSVAAPAAESAPSGPCAEVDGQSAACVAGGQNADGRTYYKGDANYNCEWQAPGVDSTNNHVPKMVHHAARLCDYGQVGIDGYTESGHYDDAMYANGSGPPDSLVERSFSARYRSSHCYNFGRRSNYLRCAYDWVR